MGDFLYFPHFPFTAEKKEILEISVTRRPSLDYLSPHAQQIAAHEKDKEEGRRD